MELIVGTLKKDQLNAKKNQKDYILSYIQIFSYLHQFNYLKHVQLCTLYKRMYMYQTYKYQYKYEIILAAFSAIKF